MLPLQFLQLKNNAQERPYIDWNSLPAAFTAIPESSSTTQTSVSDNAQWLLEKRYFCSTAAIPETNGQTKETSITQLATRVARCLASIDITFCPKTWKGSTLQWVQTLEYNIWLDIVEQRFLFNSPCLFNAGTPLALDPVTAQALYKPIQETTLQDYELIQNQQNTKQYQQQLLACFVINTQDSLQNIMESLTTAAIISKLGGGVGANFSQIREANAPIKAGVGGKASGPLTFMSMWNSMGDAIRQGGKRRAALMGIMDVDHPDFPAFIHSKQEDGKLAYFNISAGITDTFMACVQEGKTWDFTSRIPGNTTTKNMPAQILWQDICRTAYKTGDPGLVFLDRVNRDSIINTSSDWTIHSTNPCGEEPLPDFTACNLGSINLTALPTWEDFAKMTVRATYYLDLVIDATAYPTPLIEARTKLIRPVGVGFMGFADLCLLNKITYGGPHSIELVEKIGATLATYSLLSSALMVQEGKDPFPESHLVVEHVEQACAGEPNSGLAPAFSKALDGLRSLDASPELNEIVTRILADGGLRNSRRLSIAPTGSISSIADTSAGVEPNYQWVLSREVTSVTGQTTKLVFAHRYLSAEQKELLTKTNSLKDIQGLEYWVTAHEVTPQNHLGIVGALAPFIDSGISKTINMENSATESDVRAIYEAAWANPYIKGLTVYRDGSRNGQPLTAATPQKEISRKSGGQGENTKGQKVKPRPTLLAGKTYREKTPWGTLYVTLNTDEEGHPFEVFVALGKAGSDISAMVDALGRVTSLALRAGAPIGKLIKTLEGLSGHNKWVADSAGEPVMKSIPDALSQMLRKLLVESKKEAHMGQPAQARPVLVPSYEESHSCPECSAPLENVGGCNYCFGCGYSNCGAL